MKQNGRNLPKKQNTRKNTRNTGADSKKKAYKLPREVSMLLLAGLWLIIIFSLHTGRGGFLGNGLRTLFFSVFGSAAYFYAYALLVITALVLFGIHHKPSAIIRMVSAVVLITVVMLMAGLFNAEFIQTIRGESYLSTLAKAANNGMNRTGPGLLTAVLLYWMVYIIGRMGTGIFLATVAMASIWLSFPEQVIRSVRGLRQRWLGFQSRRIDSRHPQKATKEENSHRPLVETNSFTEGRKETHSQPVQLIEYEPVREQKMDTIEDPPVLHKEKPTSAEEPINEGPLTVEDTLKVQLLKKEASTYQPYRIPPLSLLHPKQTGFLRADRRKMLSKAKLLEETLASFGVEAKVIKVTQGPTITRYELQPSRGVKVSKVVNLNDDIALNLAASSIRIEAPIPGKAAIGIEIPNEEVSSVPLRELLDSTEYKRFTNPLPFVLGKNIAGDPMVFDINQMPHLLVAGATGSGKSVCINALILSLLFKSRPNEVKLLMIDPKVVELNQYNGIPHLMIPVVTDPKKATGALRWAVSEMEERYHKFAENGVRDIAGFNEKTADERLPYIVVIIDELADLMMVAAKEVEDYICRLAQMARASGIHLIIATQRPSVDVITGIIKANIPSRVAFAVASQVDSRTIIDMGGAE
ncbi:MAG: DNA translocase FtsK, partial [Bacillota bacterium]|nr:DNA translocase FtsK [Bacillota bacterium]